MPAGFRAYVPPIVGEPSPHGLLGGCIDVIETNDIHELNGTEMLSLSCGTAHAWYQCNNDPSTVTPTNPAEKTFERPQLCEFEPVTAQTGVVCSAPGMTFEDSLNRALEALRMGEQWVLENYLMTEVLCRISQPNDLTPPAGAVHLVNGIGLLETWLAQNYGGQGIIHAPIGVSSLLSLHSQVTFATEETCPQTLAGNSLVLGAGYSANVGPATLPATGCVTAPAGEAWLFVTPPMRIRRDARVTVQTSDAQAVNTVNNDRKVLAETTFVPEISCCTAAAVRVTLSACC